MPGAFTPEIGLQCGDCGAHYQLAPDGSIQDAACSECGGKRFFRSQPSGVASEGTLRNMVDSDSQMDQGGNPLGEGTIMGGDGERPRGKRDNFMHGKVAASIMDQIARLMQGLNEVQRYHVHNILRTDGPQAALRELEGQGAQAPAPQAASNDAWEMLGDPHGVTFAAFKPAETLNMEPYDLWWIDPTPPPVQKEAGFLADIPEALSAAGSALGLGGGAAGDVAGAGADAAGAGTDAAGAAGAEGDSAAGGLFNKAKSIGRYLAPKIMGAAVGHEGFEAAKGLFNDATNGLSGLDPGASGNLEYDPAQSAQALSSIHDPLLILADAWDGARGENTIIDNDDNPEKQDQKEFNSGDKKPSNPHNPNLEDSGGSGEDETHGDDLGALSPFGEESPGIERLMMMLPLLMHYAQSEQSGMGDPMVRSLHEQLESESPGYLEHSKIKHPGADKAFEILINAHGPQAGPKHANTVGPATPEQIAAVQERLMTMGKPELVPDVELHPENYDHILKEIQGNPNTAPLVDPSQATPPPAPMPPMGAPGGPGAPGGMPVPDPTQPGGGGAPMQPMASFDPLQMLADANNAAPRCPKCGSSSTRLDAHSESSPDSVEMYCPSCGNTFKPKTAASPWDAVKEQYQDVHPWDRPGDGVWMDKEQPSFGEYIPPVPDEVLQRYPELYDIRNESWEGPGIHHPQGEIIAPNLTLPPLAFPASPEYPPRQGKTADGPQDLGAQDVPAGGPGSQVWSDAQGAPLQTGSLYKLNAPGYDIPDEVMVVYKKPNELGLKLADAFSDVQSTDATPDMIITPQQMQQRHYVFTPASAASTEQGGGMPGEGPPEQTTDEAANAFPNRGMQASSREWLNEGEGVEADPETMARVAGKRFTLREQKELINEKGTARNLRDLDLSHTHYLDVDDDAFALGF